MISEYISQCKKYDKWKFSDYVTKKVKQMSVVTAKRKISVFYKEDKSTFRKAVSTTKLSSIKSLIPFKSDSWLDVCVGDGQLDAVVYCGEALSEKGLIHYEKLQT